MSEGSDASSSSCYRHIRDGDAAVLGLVLGHAPSAEASAALATGAAVSLHQIEVRNGFVAVTHSNSGNTSVTIENGPTVSTALIAWALPAFAPELPGGDLPFVSPRTQIATIFIALPADIAVASWLLTGRAATVQRRVVVF